MCRPIGCVWCPLWIVLPCISCMAVILDTNFLLKLFSHSFCKMYSWSNLNVSSPEVVSWTYQCNATSMQAAANWRWVAMKRPKMVYFSCIFCTSVLMMCSSCSLPIYVFCEMVDIFYVVLLLIILVHTIKNSFPIHFIWNWDDLVPSFRTFGFEQRQTCMKESNGSCNCLIITAFILGNRRKAYKRESQ